MTLIVYGPRGCGKTKNAEALAKHFGCSRILDDWNGRDRFEGGTLALTNLDPRDVRFSDFCSSLSFASAMKAVGLA